MASAIFYTHAHTYKAGKDPGSRHLFQLPLMDQASSGDAHRDYWSKSDLGRVSWR